MTLPCSLARFNRKVTNPIARSLVTRVSGWGLVVHRGRRSGRAYRTPVAVFGRPDGVVIALTYGLGAEWVRNVLAAGGAVVERGDRRTRLVNPRVEHDPERRLVPPWVRVFLRLLGSEAFLLLDAPTSSRS
jgi:deazaflavin-dependent oxidoreductase (nitroreductase family)